ncbi:hypothetical protein [Streptomyces sp. NPDC096013]|uniref:hypothetical protein n=1 Tax=Streptomyces sp. NPDC096013 TaxID=3366069 RepID=UPI0037FCB837
MNVDVHRVAAVALRLQSRPVADVEAEQEWSAGTQRAPEVAEDRGHCFVGDVNERPEGEQAGD